MIKKHLHKAIKDVIGHDQFTLLSPKNEVHGDYAIHKSMVPDHKLLTSGYEHELIGSVQEVGDFINFSISNAALVNELERVLTEKNDYGSVINSTPKKIILEFGQPNTHKLPHIGHLFSYIFGESLARLLEKNGDTIYRVNYQGDVGLHVAKCLRNMQDRLAEKESKTTLDERMKFLQDCYQEGSKNYEKDPEIKKETDLLNKKIFDSDTSIMPLWQETRDWCMQFYNNFESKLGINYNHHYFESETNHIGKDIVMNNVPAVFQESDGAIVYKPELQNLHTRVFINSLGLPTYEAKDLGLTSLKKQDYGFDLSIITTANEQNEYFKVVFNAAEKIFPDLIGKLKHIGFGLIDLKRGKMSSRTGNILPADQLIGAVLADAKELNPDEKKAFSISIAAIKYSFLKNEAKKNSVFDIHESLSLTGNSGPYLLYCYARAKSILEKSTDENTQILRLPSVAQAEGSDEPLAFRDDNLAELTLLRSIVKFPEVVESASQKMAPHIIATYLFDLAQKFNKLYESTPILKANESDRARLLKLISATAQVLKNGLYLLGIETLESI